MRTRTIPNNNNSSTSSTPNMFLYDGSSMGTQNPFKSSIGTTSNSSSRIMSSGLLTPSSETLLLEGQVQHQQQHNSLLDDDFQDDFNSGFDETMGNGQTLFQTTN